MICPYCDSLITTIPANGCCPNCCAPLGELSRELLAEQPAFPVPPVGLYKSNNAWLEIGEDSVRIRKEKVGFTQYTDYEIRYDELRGVLLQPAEQSTAGYLSLRCTLNQNMPFPGNAINASTDPTSVDFSVGMNAQMEQLAAFFRQCVNVAKTRAEEERQSAQIKLPPTLQGVYQGYMGSLELGETGMTVTRKIPGLLDSCYTIAYDDLFAVKYAPHTFWRNGQLDIRCWQIRRTEFTKEAFAVGWSINFLSKQENDFKKIHLALENICCRANAAREKSE